VVPLHCPMSTTASEDSRDREARHRLGEIVLPQATWPQKLHLCLSQTQHPELLHCTHPCSVYGVQHDGGVTQSTRGTWLAAERGSPAVRPRGLAFVGWQLS
jgi:hypothetical protein